MFPLQASQVGPGLAKDKGKLNYVRAHECFVEWLAAYLSVKELENKPVVTK